MLTVTNESLERVSRQFAHLMNRAKNTNSDAEAQTCVTLAQKLLWQYNLEEAQLLSLKELSQREKRSYIKDAVRVGKYTSMYNGRFDSREWKAELLAVVAKSFFCRVQPSNYREYDSIVGEPHNVKMVQDMFAYLEKQIRASRRTAWKIFQGEYRYYGQFDTLAWKESFARGCVSAIAERLDKANRQNVEEANETHEADTATPALVKFGDALVAQIFNDLDEAYYEYFPEEHPLKIKEVEYKRLLEYQARMAELEKQRQEREERIAAGLEEPKVEVKQKQYKRRGRPPMYRSTENYSAHKIGHGAGQQIQLHKSLK